MHTFPPVCWLFGLFFIGNLTAAELPAMRPALLGNGPRSFINVIDAQKLVKDGDAIVRFSCSIDHTGRAYHLTTYRGSPNSRALAEELVEKCERAMFIPAVHQHQVRWSLLSGTAILGIINGKPHLRIYLNQDEEHLKHGDDFISPQPVFWEGDRFNGFDYPNAHEELSADIDITMNIDANGNVTSSKIAAEKPAGLGFGKAVQDKIHTITFLPAYSHGRPVASTTTWHLLFKGWGHGNHWRTD